MLNASYTLRCDEKELEDFKKWCKDIKDPSDMLREFMKAAVEGNLYITNPKKKQKLKELFR